MEIFSFDEGSQADIAGTIMIAPEERSFWLAFCTFNIHWRGEVIQTRDDILIGEREQLKREYSIFHDLYQQLLMQLPWKDASGLKMNLKLDEGLLYLIFTEMDTFREYCWEAGDTEGEELCSSYRILLKSLIEEDLNSKK
ncbi:MULTISPECIES: hypothetical protein [Bacillaceae]|uniref:hypothetical protein n=1 Tax=Bacillaceae TaxID=186817 RepID=UPI000B9C668D|nr:MULTISPECIES: hypothetical protein [Bacillus]MCK6205278.1 hypothetical protein [Bacillus infantis]MDW2878993.1 hypothetical protein [Bacillus infantis]OXT16295.1 hypothetical protein B9K06_16825 [Bacillus sp. OG2]PLR74504.1 hypothetical protein CYJ37_02405 [Bacillus sp. UMB0728]